VFSNIIAIAAVVVGLGSLIFGWRFHRTEPTVAFLGGALGMLIATTGVYAALLAPTRVQAFAGPTLVITLVSATAALATSIMLWRHHSRSPQPHDVNRTNLAIALGGGAAVALLLTWVQLFFTSLAGEQQEAQQLTQREASDRERELTLYADFRFRIALIRDLTGFSPPVDPRSRNGEPLDMSDMGLRGKTLEMANLDGVKLDGADLAMTDLSGALMSGTSMRESDRGRVNLRATTLRGAVLHRAQLQNANLTEADLQGAYVHETDFQGASLDYADLRDLRCGADTNHPHDCSEDDLLELGLPGYSERPATACWPSDQPVGERRDCGGYARLVRERADGEN
jgi:uncharacterized protein YjbI with pentapeptide repeats